MTTTGKPSSHLEAALDYLQNRLPAYPFDPKIDRDFVEELLVDFAGVDVIPIDPIELARLSIHPAHCDYEPGDHQETSRRHLPRLRD